VILKAAWVVPVAGPAIRDGFVRIVGREIVSIGSGQPQPSYGEEVIELGEAVLTPGLINPHTHLELTCYAGRLRPGPLWDWLPGLVRLRRAAGQVERERQAVWDGAWECLRAGVTCVGDVSRRNLSWAALKTVPIRKVCFVELLALADDPPRNLVELASAVEQVEEDELLTVGVSPHAPYSVSAQQIRGAIELASRLGRPWCSHWAETREECAYLLGDTRALPGYLRDLLERCQVRCPGLSAIELLEQCASGAAPGTLAHFNYAQPGDAERLAAAGHTVVYCPRSHAFFGHAPHPYRRFLTAGVTVAVGTDSRASNQNLSILEELRFMRLNLPDPPPPELLLQMVTIHAARALGLHQKIGSLEIGKQADLAAFPCPSGLTEPVTAIIDRAPRPVGVWVAGQRAV